MVLLHVKRGDESQFLLQASGSTELEELTAQVARLYNARLKVQRVCSAPNEKMKQVLKKTVEEAKAIISKKQVEAGVCVTMEMVKDALDQLRGAVMIVYPMGLPPYDPIRMEFENKEDLSGTQRGQGAPAREPVLSSEEHRQLMLHFHRRQEELKKLEENDDDSCLNSPWADNTALKRHFHGVKDIKWRPR
uniref:Cilia and flagella associated protein 298 n=1 Tax=Molossus molossus TaxID=27622 RepID=A0A7J8HY82_MOLMO|nr:cilia and flagella associated protein 298 [Molossus molossus]